MSYHPHSMRTTLGPRGRGRAGLGDVATTVSAAAAVVTDPCLPEVSKLVLRLHALEQTATKPGTPPPPPKLGIGLCNAVKPLRGLVYVRERPWVLPLGAVAVVGGLLGLGFMLGRAR